MSAQVTTSISQVENSSYNSTGAVQCKLSEGNAIHVVGTFISLIIIVENVLVLAAIASRRRHPKMVLYIFIQSLAVSDLLSGVVFFYSFLFNDLLSLDNEETGTWTFRKSSIIASLVVSIASLQLISMDRFISVTYPLDHDKVVTRPRSIMLVVLVWLIGLLFVVIPISGWNCLQYCVCETATLDGTPNCPHSSCSRLFPPTTNSYVMTSIGIFVVLACGITFCNAAVFAKVKRHFNRMARSRTSKKSKKDEKELATFMATVFIVFLVCWLPSVILLGAAAQWLMTSGHPVLYVVILYNFLCRIDSTQPGVIISDDVFDLSSMPALLNSLINPWLYAIKLQSCRKVLVGWFCKCLDLEKRNKMFKLSHSVQPGVGSSGGRSHALHNIVNSTTAHTSFLTSNSATRTTAKGHPKSNLLNVPGQQDATSSVRSSFCSGSEDGL